MKGPREFIFYLAVGAGMALGTSAFTMVSGLFEVVGGLWVLLAGSLLLKLVLLIPAHATYPVRDSGDYYSTARHLYKTGNYVGSRTPV